MTNGLLWAVLKNYRNKNFDKNRVGLCTFWGIFSQTFLVTLGPMYKHYYSVVGDRFRKVWQQKTFSSGK
jgi:uncharacterized membrane protein